ncbi:MAG: tRNA (adenosine(37)-N6)-threonylcarbamoyltransferase complex ATPase subunit type 1 TsaE [Bacteroidales bacterium]|nr:tRNA (adenosine(37)-N6)-threonylcarbamoyltransferase complex ATPase subunit type 1 TsaE [Bacteroidales bacterium]
MDQKLTQIICKQPEELDGAAKILLDKYPSHRLFALYGEMGAGKTTFIKSICKKLNVIDNVSSPTFAIVNVYQTQSKEDIYHFDFYRIKSLEEVYDIGYEDYFFSDLYCLLEWPEKIKKLLPEDTITVEIKVDHSTQSRTIIF